MKRLLTALLFALPVSASAQYTPLDQSLSFDLNANPIVTAAGRTQDFTPFLGQEWMNFLWNSQPVANGVYRQTMAVRARDGLASFLGNFGGAGPNGFPNSGPMFTPGSTLLYLFDAEVPANGQLFSFTLTDLDGDTRTATFQAPGGAPLVTPEPATWVLMAAGLVAVGFVRRRRV